MHPIERLRHVARASGAGPTLTAQDAAGALLGFGDDPAALVTACRRLIDRHLESGPLWWVAAHALCAGDVGSALRSSVDALAGDPTAAVLAAQLPEGADVLVVGWPEHVAEALARRGDVRVLAASADGEGDALARSLGRAGFDAEAIADAAVAAAAVSSSLILLEASAMGPTAFLGARGSHAAAAAARHAGVPVWVAAGVGRVLPGRLWDALAARLDAVHDAWSSPVDTVPLDLADIVVGPDGPGPAAAAPARADAPIAAELLKPGPA